MATVIGYYSSPEGSLWERVVDDGNGKLAEAIDRWATSVDNYREMLAGIGSAMVLGDSGEVPAKHDGSVWFEIV